MARAKKPASTGDIIRSLAVILVPLIVITFFFTRGPSDHPVTVVDWKPVLTTARSEAPYPVLAPVNLPDGWRATRVTWVQKGEPYLNGQDSPRDFWELGFLNPDDVYLGLTQGDADLDVMVADETRSGVPDGESSLGGQTWRRVVSPDGRTHSLVLAQPKVTSVVSGDLPYEALESYVTTLATS